MSAPDHRTLFTIFNRNDPSPTARALRNLSFESAFVLIVDEKNFNKKHRENLKRLKTWMTGSPRFHVKQKNNPHGFMEWPDRLWKDEWSWSALLEKNIQFLSVKEIDISTFESAGQRDIVDLTSGTKKQCADIIRAIDQLGANASFVLQTRNGHTLNLSSGEELKNTIPLSFRERVWLSSGYIVDFTRRGEPKSGKKWSDCVKEQTKSGKILPNATEIQASLGLNHPINLEAGYWLEHAVTHMMSSWPQISESYIAPRLINPSCGRSAGACFFTISASLKSRGVQKMMSKHVKEIRRIGTIRDFAEKSEAVLRFMRDTEFSKKESAYVIDRLHSIEFDAVAFDHDSGHVYACECKSMTSITNGVLSRINSITKLAFPTYGTSILVYAGRASATSYGVHKISWPELSSSTVLEDLPLAGKIYPSAKSNGTQIQNTNRLIAPSQEQLGELLLIIRKDPRDYVNFLKLLENNGFRAKGTLKRINQLSTKLGFSIDYDRRDSQDWIIWGSDK